MNERTFSRPVRERAAKVARILVIALGVGCATLPDIEPGVCGNGVVETHEDCDSFPPAGSTGLTCGSATGPTACLLVADAAKNCPSGYVFGPKDNVCRKPTNGFKLALQLSDVSGARPVVANFDGDAFGDLTMVTSAGVNRDIHFMAEGGVRSTFTASTSALFADAVGSFDGDGLADIVAPSTFGLGVRRGREDGSFQPSVFSQEKWPAAKAVAIPISYVDQAGASDTDTIGFITRTGQRLFLSCIGPECDPIDLGWIDTTNEFDPARVSAIFADIDEDDDPSLLLTVEGADHIRVIPPLHKGAAFNLTLPPSADITGPPYTFVPTSIAGGIFFIDADGDVDGHRDIVVSAGSAAPPKPSALFVKAGPRSAWTTMEFDGTLAKQNFVSAPLVGAGHFDGSARAGFVFPSALYVFSDPFYVPVAKSIGFGDWTGVAVGDVNGDGFDDLAGVSTDPGMDLVLGGTTGFTAIRLSSDTALADVVAADFDGDGSIDLVAHTNDHFGCDKEESVFGWFGRSLAFPDGPFLLAAVPHISSVAALHTILDGIGDIALQFRAPEGDHCAAAPYPTSVLLGSTDRELSSPLILASPDPLIGSPFGVPLHPALGDIDRDGRVDVVTTGMAFDEKAGASTTADPTPDLSHPHLLLYELLATDGNLVAEPALDLGPNRVPFYAALALGDIDGGGALSAVVWAPTIAPDASPVADVSLEVTRIDYGGQPQKVHVGGDATLVSGLASGQTILPARELALDIDHDGRTDFVGALTLPPDAGSAGENAPKACFILWNDPAAAQGLRPERITIPDPFAVVDVGVVHDTDGIEHLLIATSSALYVYEAGAAHKLYAPPGTETDSRGRIQGIASGDVNGDGLEDIVLTLSAKTLVLERLATVDGSTPDFSLDSIPP